jgi:RNA polymerase sigma-70 factor, ECF subfamily
MSDRADDEIQVKLHQAMIKVANHRDKKAFGVLFVYFVSRLFYFSLRYVGDPHNARDIAQETLAMIWQKASLFDQDKGSVTTWVYTIARNICYDMGRQQARRPLIVSSEDIYEDMMVQDWLLNDFQDLDLDKDILHRLVHQLPKNQSDVIELVYLHDMSQLAVAEHLQLPLGTVKSRIRLALNKLKQLTSKEMKGYE